MPIRDELRASIAASQAARLRDVDGALGDDEEIARFLTECCARRLPAKVVLADAAMSCRFATATAERVTLELLEVAPRTLAPATPCAVSLIYNGKATLFLSETADQTAASATQRATLTLALPQRVEGPERRAAVRIPVVYQSGMTVQLQRPGAAAWEVAPVDLSVTGILVQLTEPAALHQGERFGADIRLDALRATVPVEVRRVAGDRCGLAFVDAGDGTFADTLHVLASVVDTLDRLWLERRYRSFSMMLGRHPIVACASHTEASCCHCGEALTHCLGTPNPPGFGEFVGECRRCLLFTWYDLATR